MTTPLKMADALLQALKRYNPTRVRAYATDDGDARDIAVPTRRKKWTQVIAAIDARSWSRVEMLDKAGAILGYVENTGPAAELENLSGDRTAGELRLAERIVSMVTRAQRDVMTFRDAEVTALLKAQGDVVREMTTGMRELSSMYREQVGAAEQLAEMRTRAEQVPQKDQLTELLEALPTLLQALPLLKGLLGSGAAPSVAASAVNGVKGGH